jgi:hypothetical protein
MSHASAFGALAGYLPGALLGVGVFIAGQIALAWPHAGPKRAGILVLSCLLAWRLALWAREFGGPGSWVMASVVGTLGVAAGILLAWPRQARRKRVLAALAATGVAGGLLFAAAYELRLHFAGRFPGRWWPLLLICLWQAGLVATAAWALRLTNDTPRP